MFVEGNVSEVVSFRDAFVKWEKKASLKWKTINRSPQSRVSRGGAVRKSGQGKCMDSVQGLNHEGKCREGADQSQDHCLNRGVTGEQGPLGWREAAAGACGILDSGLQKTHTDTL